MAYYTHEITHTVEGMYQYFYSLNRMLHQMYE